MFRLNDTLVDPVRQYDDGLALIGHTEAVGLDSAWITSHHFGSDKGGIPSPLLYLAAAGQHTSRIRLGASVVVLTLEDPLRVAEDAALADALVRGRLELGLGSGLEDWAFEPFGVEWSSRHEVFERKLTALRRALRGEDLGGGRRLHPPGRDLDRRVWRVASDPASAGEIARAGDNLLLASSKQLSAEENRLRRAEAIRRFRAEANVHQRVGTSRSVVVAATDEEATRIFGAEAAARHRANGSLEAWVGDATSVRESARSDEELHAVDEVLLQVAPGRLTLRQWRDTLTRFAVDVLPDLERIPVP